MKPTIIYFLIFCTCFTKAQVVFCPPGAQWNYEFYSGWFTPNHGNHKIVYERDSILALDTCKIIRHNYLLTPCSPYVPISLIKQKGDTVFFRNQRTDHNWEILYNFAAKKGDGWQTKVRQSNDNLATFTFSVDSVDFVVYKGHILKRLILASGNIGSQQIVERIGSFHYMFNYLNSNWGVCKSYTPHGILCYQDSTFEQTMLSELPCDFATSINTIEDNPAKINIYPNPIADFFDVELPAFFESAELNLSLFDSYGKEVLIQTLNNRRISLGEFDEGIYFMQIKQGNSLIYKAKVVKANKQ